LFRRLLLFFSLRAMFAADDLRRRRLIALLDARYGDYH